MNKEEKIDIEHDWEHFKFGDKIVFTDTGFADRYLNREFLFIELSGEDYMLYDLEEKDTVHIRAYYLKECVKIKEEQRTVPTWEVK